MSWSINNTLTLWVKNYESTDHTRKESTQITKDSFDKAFDEAINILEDEKNTELQKLFDDLKYDLSSLREEVLDNNEQDNTNNFEQLWKKLTDLFDIYIDNGIYYLHIPWWEVFAIQDKSFLEGLFKKLLQKKLALDNEKIDTLSIVFKEIKKDVSEIPNETTESTKEKESESEEQTQEQTQKQKEKEQEIEEKDNSFSWLVDSIIWFFKKKSKNLKTQNFKDWISSFLKRTWITEIAQMVAWFFWFSKTEEKLAELDEFVESSPDPTVLWKTVYYPDKYPQITWEEIIPQNRTTWLFPQEFNSEKFEENLFSPIDSENFDKMLVNPNTRLEDKYNIIESFVDNASFGDNEFDDFVLVVLTHWLHIPAKAGDVGVSVNARFPYTLINTIQWEQWEGPLSNDTPYFPNWNYGLYTALLQLKWLYDKDSTLENNLTNLGIYTESLWNQSDWNQDELSRILTLVESRKWSYNDGLEGDIYNSEDEAKTE